MGIPKQASPRQYEYVSFDPASSVFFWIALTVSADASLRVTTCPAFVRMTICDGEFGLQWCHRILLSKVSHLKIRPSVILTWYILK
jgi:hypothetical protein